MTVWGLGSIANYINASRAKVKRLIDRGLLPVAWEGVDIGRRYHAESDALDEWKRRRGPPAPLERPLDKGAENT